MSVSEAVEVVATDGATTLAFQHVYHSSTQHIPAYGPLSPPSAPPPCLVPGTSCTPIVPPYPPPPHHPTYPPPLVPMCSPSPSTSVSSPLILSCSSMCPTPRPACPPSSPPCPPPNSTCGPLSPVAASPYFGLDRDMTSPSLHSTTPSAQSSLVTPQPSPSPVLSNPGLSLLTFAQPCPSPGPLSPVIPCMCQGDPTCPSPTTGYCDTSYPCVIYTVMPSYPVMPLYNQEEEEQGEESQGTIDQCNSDMIDQTVYLSPMPLPPPPPQANIEEIGECQDKKISHTEAVEDGELDDDERELEDEMKVLSLSAGHIISPQPSDRMGLFGSDGCWYPVCQPAPQQTESALSCHRNTLQEFTSMSCDTLDRCPQLHSPDQSFTNMPANPRNQSMPSISPHPGKTDVLSFNSVRPNGPRGLPRLSLPFHRSSEWPPDFAPPYPRAPDWLPNFAPPFYKPKSVMLGGPRRFPMFPEQDTFPRPNMMMPGPRMIGPGLRGPWPGGPMMVRARQISLMPFYNYFHDLDLPVNTLGRPRLLHSLPSKGHISVEEVWVRHMGALFRNLPHPWLLTAAPRGKQPTGSSWSTFKDLAKVRFYCKVCSDGWTSMYGVVVFCYRQDKVNGAGTVLYQVAGQKCRLCHPSAAQEFQLPLWYPEEAQKVITNLYYNIASTLYGLVTPKYIRTRRLGMPLTHHNQLLCQGCSQGVCKLDNKGGENAQEQQQQEESTHDQQQQQH